MRLVERRQDPTRLIDALRHLADEVARDDRIRQPAPAVVTELLARHAGRETEQTLDDQRVAKSERRDQSSSRPVVLDRCVRRLRHAVAERRDSLQQPVEPRAREPLETVQHPLLELLGDSRNLLARNPSRRVHHDEVGERILISTPTCSSQGSLAGIGGSMLNPGLLERDVHVLDLRVGAQLLGVLLAPDAAVLVTAERRA